MQVQEDANAQNRPERRSPSEAPSRVRSNIRSRVTALVPMYTHQMPYLQPAKRPMQADKLPKYTTRKGRSNVFGPLPLRLHPSSDDQEYDTEGHDDPRERRSFPPMELLRRAAARQQIWLTDCR